MVREAGGDGTSATRSTSYTQHAAHNLPRIVILILIQTTACRGYINSVMVTTYCHVFGARSCSGAGPKRTKVNFGPRPETSNELNLAPDSSTNA